MGRRAALLSCKKRWISLVAIGEKVTLAAQHLQQSYTSHYLKPQRAKYSTNRKRGSKVDSEEQSVLESDSGNQKLASVNSAATQRKRGLVPFTAGCLKGQLYKILSSDFFHHLNLISYPKIFSDSVLILPNYSNSKFDRLLYTYYRGMWKACNLTAFIPCLTGPVDHPFASRHERPGFNTRGYLCDTGILLLALSRYKQVKMNFIKSFQTQIAVTQGS